MIRSVGSISVTCVDVELTTDAQSLTVYTPVVGSYQLALAALNYLKDCWEH